MSSRERLLRIVIRSLRFDRENAGELRAVAIKEWTPLLAITDELRLTLPLGLRCREALPEGVRVRIDRNLAGNAVRYARAIPAHREIIDTLDREGVPFVFLKGLSHFPHFSDSPVHRQQYDIDLYTPPENLEKVHHAITGLRYRAVERGREEHADHLPIMIRNTDWCWRGDYYDPEMPLHLELHFRLWDAGTELFDVAGLEDVWHRREYRAAGALRIPALNLHDTVRYAAWHLVRHLLRGSVSPGHVYEFAHFLDRTAADDPFWEAWNRANPDRLVAEALAIRLASDCFGCRLNAVACALMNSLPATVRKWFDLFALSPLLSIVRPNKDELLLHLLLISGKGRFRVALRRLIPSLPALFVRNPYHDAESGRLPFLADHAAFLRRRAIYHLLTFGTLARSGVRWMKTIS